MGRSMFLFLGTLALIGSISHASTEVGAKEFVVTLDNSNFTDFVSRHDFIIVEFYVPWCGACQQFVPQYEEAASILSKEDPPIILAKVDVEAERNKPLKAKFGIKTFPTIKILRNGGSGVQDLKRSADVDGFVADVKKQTGPASHEITSAERVAALLEGKKLAVIGVFPEFSGENFENFTILTERLRLLSDHELGHTSDAKLLPRGDSSITGPVVRLFKPFDELVVDFQDFNVNSLEKLIKESSVPTLTVFDKDLDNVPYVSKFFDAPGPKALLFMDFTSEHSDAFRSKYYDIAKQYKGKGLSFLMGDVEASQAALEFLGVKEDQPPVLTILADDNQKYMKVKVETDQIEAWLNEFTDGHLQPYRKSKPIPLENTEPVKVVVADSLNDFILKSKKNVLLELYAPWSTEYQELVPVLDEVAAFYKKDADVIIAKLDYSENDVDPQTFEIHGSPTIYFKSASGNIMLYDGTNTKEDIISFVEKNRDKAAVEVSRKDEL